MPMTPKNESPQFFYNQLVSEILADSKITWFVKNSSFSIR